MTANIPSQFVKVERRNAAADVREQLMALIRSGTLRVNERLPPEMELARSFGVSRPVVREALVSLQALGMVASQNGRGTYVTSDQVTPPLLMGLYSPTHLNAVRRFLEVPAASQAAEQRSDRQLERISALLTEMDACSEPSRRTALDAEFHIAVAEAAGNPLLVKLIGDLRTVLEEHSMAAAAAPNRRTSAAEEHRRIVEAIRQGDPVAAGEAMAAHLDAADNAFVLLAGDTP